MLNFRKFKVARYSFLFSTFHKVASEHADHGSIIRNGVILLVFAL